MELGRWLQQALRYITSSARYGKVLRTDRVVVTYVIRALALKEVSHLVRQVELLTSVLDRCEGRVAMPQLQQ